MNWCRRWWENHSLTAIMTVGGVGLLFLAFRFEPGPWFDLWLGLGQGMLTAALLFWLSRWFRETTRPED
jgi:hypothetical protein